MTADPVFALLIDGTHTQIREVDPADREAVRRLHAGMSPESRYMRFFSLSRDIGTETADRICREPGSSHAAVGAWVAGELVGVASYEVTGTSGVAEIGMVVADTMHQRGVGTLLLEHLASLARSRGLRAFSADTLAQNHAMQRVFADAGLSLRRHCESGVVEYTMPLTADARYLDAVGERERQADLSSLEHLLRPKSIPWWSSPPAWTGIVAVDGLGELLDAAALFACQPVPAGPRVAIVSTAGGAGVLAADACADAGLTIAELALATREALRDLLPTGACDNPIDTGAAVAPDRFRRTLERVSADDGVDAVIAIVAPTAASDLVPELRAGRKPIAAVVLGQDSSVEVRPGRVPSYAYPENAARALASAWSYGRWRARPPGREPELPGIHRYDAARFISAHLGSRGGWLSPADSMELLSRYGLPLAPWRTARSADEAVRAAAELGGDVALKAQVPGLVHKSDVGAVELGLRGESDVRRAYRALADRFAGRLDGVLLQRMAPAGVEVLCGITQEPVFGPLIVFGLGGVATDVLGDAGARLTPLTDLDATSLDLNPIIATPEGAVVVDARVRIVPQRHWDPYLRRLR